MDSCLVVNFLLGGAGRLVTEVLYVSPQPWVCSHWYHYKRSFLVFYSQQMHGTPHDIWQQHRPWHPPSLQHQRVTQTWAWSLVLAKDTNTISSSSLLPTQTYIDHRYLLGFWPSRNGHQHRLWTSAWWQHSPQTSTWPLVVHRPRTSTRPQL